MLAAVYKSTELSMIQDKSEDYRNTWEFLDRRIEGVCYFSTNVKCENTGAKMFFFLILADGKIARVFEKV